MGTISESNKSNVRNQTNPMLRQTSISELPYDEWAESEVLQATMGSDEDVIPSYSPEVAEMMMIEDPEMRKNNLSKEIYGVMQHMLLEPDVIKKKEKMYAMMTKKDYVN